MAEKKKDLRTALVNSGLITQDQLNIVADDACKTGESLIRAILAKKLLDEKQILKFLEEEMGIPHISLTSYLIDQKTIETLPPSIAKKYGVIPLFLVQNTLSIAMVDPFDVKAIDEIKVKTKHEVEVMAATPTDINQAIVQFYGVAGTLDELLGAMATPETSHAATPSTADEAPISKLINLLLVQAVQERASDIHIEPEEKRTRVRYRIDGIMHEVSSPPSHLHSSICSRIKVLAKMDIAETRVAQDGRFEFKFENRSIDVRVSSFPTIYGEAVVMRLLDKQSMVLSLGEIGFSESNLKKFDELVKRPYGIILVTGPTGSGKTTTLYATLQHILTPERNIVTVEDPVEYEMAGIRQTQVNVKAGMVFATALRSILRQDPDVILVGEIRDMETGGVAIEAALTGHLVFSTLHTNDAPGALTRLVDMGVEPFLVASATAGIIAQRLIRKICANCKIELEVSQEITDSFEQLKGKKHKFFHGKGCKNCRGTGYKGRTAIFEMLTLTDEMKNQIVNKEATSKIKQTAVKNGMVTLREDGLQKALAGLTTLDEVLRVTQLD
ncbi:MAG: type IV pilus assembly protein PilB [Candidatus Saganbacteria bacterium]|uniref:Type IV pilus assembly protein PilB n=1 Tax=Candidatus Saganbacteria bacterium TaxID=2575572 RepID=A0A833L0E7_UNCSA|nr:MAG: type IV pilus assembly protein PilB [Candidatus Saganbacteria bacterium]